MRSPSGLSSNESGGDVPAPGSAAAPMPVSGSCDSPPQERNTVRETAMDLGAARVGIAPAGVASLFLHGPEGTRVAVPQLWLADDQSLPRLEWRPELDREVDRHPEWLADFVKLANAEPTVIAAFARQHGILGLNRDGHAGLREGSSPLTPFDWFWENEDQRHERYRNAVTTGQVIDRFWEPIEAWRFFARRFRAILRIAFELQEERGPANEDFIETTTGELGTFNPRAGWRHSAAPLDEEAIHDLMKPRLGPGAPSPLERGRFALTKVITELLTEVRPSLRLNLSESGPGRLLVGIPFRGESDDRDEPWCPFLSPEAGLYVTLVVQLVASVTSPLGLVRCSWCHNPYARPSDRAPRADRRRFCTDDCRAEAKKEADRTLSRRRYERQRGGHGATNPASE